jgi:hypothetical protein
LPSAVSFPPGLDSFRSGFYGSNRCILSLFQKRLQHSFKSVWRQLLAYDLNCSIFGNHDQPSAGNVPVTAKIQRVFSKVKDATTAISFDYRNCD